MSRLLRAVGVLAGLMCFAGTAAAGPPEEKPGHVDCYGSRALTSINLQLRVYGRALGKKRVLNSLTCDCKILVYNRGLLRPKKLTVPAVQGVVDPRSTSMVSYVNRSSQLKKDTIGDREWRLRAEALSSQQRVHGLEQAGFSTVVSCTGNHMMLAANWGNLLLRETQRCFTLLLKDYATTSNLTLRRLHTAGEIQHSSDITEDGYFSQ
jgi:hypothetical protein